MRRVKPGDAAAGRTYRERPMTLPTTTSDQSTSALPTGRHLTITWGIPDEYGGMTAALLHRSRAFWEVAGAAVEIVTFDPAPRWEATRRLLRGRGELAAGTTLRNPFEDVRTQQRAPATVGVRPGDATRPHDEEAVDKGGTILRWRKGDAVVRTEHRRTDGSVALLDERGRDDVRRLLTAFDREGAPTGQWRSAAQFSFAWLDSLLDGDRAFAIVDSKAAAPLMQQYRRSGVTLIYMLHGSHLAGQDPAVLDESRRPVLESLDVWDAVVVQTERQRCDIIDLLGDSGNLAVVSNPLSVRDGFRRLPPDRLHGVIVSRLSALKRLDHALQAIAGVRAMGCPVTAEFVGDGRQRARLERRARELGLESAVRFTGYAADGRERFRSGGWTLLTSRSEGGALTLVEAMEAGCLPIAYDVRYGPAEVIDHRRNGWLVRDADVEAATRALYEACVLPDDEIAAMRRLAHRTALARNEQSVVLAWAEVLGAARRRHDRAHDPADRTLERVRVRYLRGRYLITTLRARSTPVVARIEVRLRAPDRPIVRTDMHRLGRIWFVRLTKDDSAALGGGAVHVRFSIAEPGGITSMDAGTRHPDPRSIPQRAIDRAMRLLQPGTPTSRA